MSEPTIGLVNDLRATSEKKVAPVAIYQPLPRTDPEHEYLFVLNDLSVIDTERAMSPLLTD
ncbi:hypothetical protein ACFYTS_19150 [Nocardia sp. NPDC004151]|uniref:hypothetical protein n=1 Tax=Nocardia sp. NPDC004151 TaxID=3364304 RepID=UPI0036C41ED8